MLSTIGHHLKASAVTLLIAANTVFWGVPIHLLALVKLVARPDAWRKACAAGLIRLVQGWIGGVLLIQERCLDIAWDIRLPETLSRNQWYVVLCNHRSWADIPALLKTLTGRVPFPVVFAKQQMFRVPIIGTALWALDYPIMKRHSRAFLRRHPEKRGQDLATTRRSCRKYHFTPVSILNFIEGTRFTPEKHDRQQSPFRHLLRPKAGGLAFALEAMEGRIHRLLDVTVVYPDDIVHFWSYLGGRVRRVTVHIREIAIPPRLLRGDYAGDHRFRQEFQTWISQIWREKDALIDHMLESRENRSGHGVNGRKTGRHRPPLPASDSLYS